MANAPGPRPELHGSILGSRDMRYVFVFSRALRVWLPLACLGGCERVVNGRRLQQSLQSRSLRSINDEEINDKEAMRTGGARVWLGVIASKVGLNIVNDMFCRK